MYYFTYNICMKTVFWHFVKMRIVCLLWWSLMCCLFTWFLYLEIKNHRIHLYITAIHAIHQTHCNIYLLKYNLIFWILLHDCIWAHSLCWICTHKNCRTHTHTRAHTHMQTMCIYNMYIDKYIQIDMHTRANPSCIFQLLNQPTNNRSWS